MSWPMVRNLLFWPRMVTCARWLGPLTLAACVIPVPADLDDKPDAAIVKLDADPVITDSQPPMPGLKPLVANQQFSVTLRDADLGDTLYLRIFRNYDTSPGPIAVKAVPNDAQHPTELRGPIGLDTTSWCPSALAGNTITIDVMVADRPFDEDISKMPQYRVVTQNGRGTIRSWVLTCPVQ
jgi:hypothetical protein